MKFDLMLYAALLRTDPQEINLWSIGEEESEINNFSMATKPIHRITTKRKHGIRQI